MRWIRFSCGSTPLETPRDWVSLVHEIAGTDSDVIEVASTVLHGPHLSRMWDIRELKSGGLAEVSACIKRTLCEYMVQWAPGFYRCLVIRARSDVQLLRSRPLSAAISSPPEMCGRESLSLIELPPDLVRCIENYLDAGRTAGDVVHAAALIGERVARLWSARAGRGGPRG